MPSSTDKSHVPVVWIVNLSGHNYEPAKKFGRFISLTTGNVNHFNVDRLAQNMAITLAVAHEEDYLLISGSPMLNVIAVQLWLRKFTKVKLLQFSTREEAYIPRTLFAATLDRLAAQD